MPLELMTTTERMILENQIAILAALTTSHTDPKIVDALANRAILTRDQITRWDRDRLPAGIHEAETRRSKD